MPLPARPSVPIPPLVSSFFSRFPLVVYHSEEPASSAAPSIPTIWQLGPPPASSSESLDPYSRQAAALARFLGISTAPRWLSSPAGAPGRELPSMHLPDGSLLSRDEISAHLLGKADVTSAAVADAAHQAYTALVQTKLLPAVLAALYLTSGSSPGTAVVPRDDDQPWLSALAASWTAVPAHRRARIAEIKRLRGGKEGVKVAIDLEAVERDAVEAIGALESRVRQGEGESRWFGGSESPTPLDASLYALLSIVLELRGSEGDVLKERLDRCPALLAWVKDKRP